MSIHIVPEPAAPDKPPTLRYYRIPWIVFNHNNLVYAADGVVTVDGVAYLGQVKDGAHAGFTVNAFVRPGDAGFLAPAGWQADVTASSILNPRGDGEDPPPAQAAQPGPTADDGIRYYDQVQRRRGLVAQEVA